MPGGSFIAKEGRNCWRRAVAGRLAFLVDGDAYFHALRLALKNAERSVLIIGWEFDSRVRLVRGAVENQTIGELFHSILEDRPQLTVHVLIWNSALIYSLDREFLPVIKHDWLSHRRLHFRLDDCHPLGASHHQKLVVIDDRMAFLGGMDISARRWDTSEHRLDEPRRSDPGFPAYGPFHDVQVAVSGAAAAALGELARNRWLTATGQRLPRPPATADPWPASLPADVVDGQISIARTEPCWRGSPAITEVRALLVDLVNAAQANIYVENQYFASRLISRSFYRRLTTPDCPEIAVITSGSSAGWLEARTMGLSRDFFQARLQAADRLSRLRFYYPLIDGLWLKVHSKVMVVDDRFLCIGSSNFNNRSLGLDSECNILLEAAGRRDVAAAIAGLRDRLLGEHLDRPPSEVARRVAGQGLHAAIDSLRGSGRCLFPVTVAGASPGGTLEARSFDPETPLELSLPPTGPAVLRIAAGILLLAGLTAWSGLGPFEPPSAAIAAIRDDPLSPLLLCGLFLMFGMTGLPIFLPMVAAGSLFGVCPGSLYALLGALASAAFSYSLGRSLGRPLVRRLAGRRMRRLGRALVRHDVVALAVLRLLPVTSFTSVSLAAGAQRVAPKAYFTGTAVGAAPAVVAFTLFGDRVAAQLQSPEPANLALLVAAALFLVLAGTGMLYRLSRAAVPDQKGYRR